MILNIICIEYGRTPRIVRNNSLKDSYNGVCAVFVHQITQANPTYILVRMCTTPMKESHVEENHTAQIWRSGPKNILVTASRELYVTRHVSRTRFAL